MPSDAHKWANDKLDPACIYKHFVPNGTNAVALCLLLSAYCLLFLYHPPVNIFAKLSTGRKLDSACHFFKLLPGTMT